MQQKVKKITLIVYMITVGMVLHPSESPKKYHAYKLITVLYNETNEERLIEYKKCLDKNLAHYLIDTVHVIYDTSKDNQNNYLLKYLKSKNVRITYFDGRPSYGYCFDLANRLYPNRRIILCNADIYFNYTLEALNEFNLNNTLLALTRWTVLPNNLGVIPYTPDWDPEYSQDSWIFQTPFNYKFGNDIKMGIPRCDSTIAYMALTAGLRVLNPSQTIQCCHLHMINVRNYNNEEAYPLENVIKVPRTPLPSTSERKYCLHNGVLTNHSCNH